MFRNSVLPLAKLPFAVSTLIILIAGCSKPPPGSNNESDSVALSEAVTESGAGPHSVLRVASTTSTRDSGLLDTLLPLFEKQHHCRVDLIAVGTGAALKLGETGDADAVLVHARSAEAAFMEAGHGIRREPVMHNQFIVAGPIEDPAGAKGRDALAALANIAAGKHRFVSRGDDSGTHKRESSLWRKMGGRPEWKNFVETGQGMGPTLVMADEMNAYVLTDEGTWLHQSSDFQIVPIVEGASDLNNPYSVMVVNPNRHPAVKSELADAFVDFLISDQAQHMINAYKVNGHQLFQADRLAEATVE